MHAESSLSSQTSIQDHHSIGPALDVVVESHPEEPAFPRLRASIERSDPLWAGELFRLPRHSMTGDEEDRNPWVRNPLPGTAPWVLMLLESDIVGFGALGALESLVGTVKPEITLVRLVLGELSVRSPAPERLLVRRRHSSAGMAEEGPGLAVACSSRLIAPLGIMVEETSPDNGNRRGISGPPNALPFWSPGPDWGEPAMVLGGDAPDAGWTMSELAREALAPGAAWVLLASPDWRQWPVSVQAARRAALLVDGGASAIVLCRADATDPPAPAWARAAVAVGDAVEVAAMVCQRADLKAVIQSVSRHVSAVVEAIIAAASRDGGCSFHLVGQQVVNQERVVPRFTNAVVSVPIVVPAAAPNALGVSASGVDPRSSAGAGGVASFSSRSVQPLELVFDARQRRLLLSTPLAPLPIERYPERVVIGGVEGFAYPGTDAVTTLEGDRLSSSSAPVPLHRFDDRLPPPTNELLGHFPRGALNDCASLHEVGELGKAALRRSFGRDIAHLVVPGAQDGLMVHRAPRDARCPKSATVSAPGSGTVVLNLGRSPSDSLVFRHPDAFGLAAAFGVSVRAGPWVTDRPTPHSRPLRFPYGLIGYGRTTPEFGDAAETGPEGRWWGLAPARDLVPLLRWSSRQGPRYTTSDRPRLASGKADRHASFTHVLGWVLRVDDETAADNSGLCPIFEWFHPRRRAWWYGSDPEEKRRSGFRRMGIIGALDHRRGAAHVPLFRSSTRRGATTLHTARSEAGGRHEEQLAGWLRATTATLPYPWSVEGFDPAGGEQLQPAPWPGAWPVFELTHHQHAPKLGFASASIMAQGWMLASMVGYVAERGAPRPEVGWLLWTLQRQLRQSSRWSCWGRGWTPGFRIGS
ncbi:MAG: hypothetical protein ACKV2O_21185 [Acidimicrobiales bacterium]